MKNFYGPYHSNGNGDLWHWNKGCPDFPKENYVSLITNKKLEEEKLCPVCKAMDAEAKTGPAEPVSNS